MKIGILTYHRAHNYGALLQAYALRTYLQQIGHEAEVVDYWPQYHMEAYQLFPLKMFLLHSFLGKLKFILLFCLGLSRMLKRRKGYFSFMNERLNLSRYPRYLTGELINEDYDFVVYGSDQIWRKQNARLFKGFDCAYFGDFPKNVKYRISYAASMGEINLTEQDRLLIKQKLKSFHEISVREENLKHELVQLGFSASVVLDPTLLLCKKDWEKLLVNTRINKPKKYILFYHLIFSDEALALVEKIKEQLGYEVFEIRNVVKPLLIGTRYKYQATSPEKFLLLLKDAEFVITTSFHGTAFSILFEKQFYALGMGNNSMRSCTLLSSLGLRHRYLDVVNNFNLYDLIDYKVVNTKLEELRNGSQDFLENSLESLLHKNN